ncbi:MAG TPA: hypothetical protein VKA80_04635 [Beijerinckiaceae bacterium]|nr:hypothetical protein [Beijerinckiaceae bacterium]
MAFPFNATAVRFRPRDRQTLVVVRFVDGTRGYARVDPQTAAYGGERLLAAVRERQASGQIPAGAIAEITRTR